MILTCPSCATSYSVDEAKLGPAGRTVRCAACGERWAAKPEGELELTATVVEDGLPAPAAATETPLAEKPAEELPKVFRARAEEAKGVREAIINGAVWAAMAACLALVIGAAGFFRVDVVRLIPRASGAYAMVGLPVNPTGLEFEGVTAHPALQNGHNALVVSGVIRNVQDRAVSAPPLKVSVLDKAGKALKTTISHSDPAHIAPGETRHFMVAVLDPPAAADDVEVVFTKVRADKPKAVKEKPHAQAALRGSAAAPPAPVIQAMEAKPIPADSPYALQSHDDHG